MLWVAWDVAVELTALHVQKVREGSKARSTCHQVAGLTLALAPDPHRHRPE